MSDITVTLGARVRWWVKPYLRLIWVLALCKIPVNLDKVADRVARSRDVQVERS